MTYHTTLPRPPSIETVTSTPVVFKLRLGDPTSDLLVHHIRLLRDCVALSAKRWGFRPLAAVVLPAEMQLLARFEGGEFGMQQAAALIQSTFARHLPDAPDQLWDEAPERTVLSWAAVPLRTAFIEAAPVRLGLVTDPRDWPYSSIHQKTPQTPVLGVAMA